MKAEIIATGKEILTGDVADTNSSVISKKLTHAGIDVLFHHCCGDNEEHLADLIEKSSQKSDIVIVTGGLGPTEDDRTRQAAAIVLNCGLSLNKKAYDSVKEFFIKRDIEMPEVNQVQAVIPEKSEFIENISGTAPGLFFRHNNTNIYCLTGVPFELEKMLDKIFDEKIKSLDFYVSRKLTVFKMPESAVGEELSDFYKKFPDEKNLPKIDLGIQAVFPHIFVSLYATGNKRADIEKRLNLASEYVIKKLQNNIVSYKGETLFEKAAGFLKEKNLTLSVAESCTGGLIGNLLTDISGSSDFFKLSAVTYSNESKTDILGVDPETIKKYGAVSYQCAEELACGAKLKGRSDFGVSTTGIAGPTGGVKGKPVGTVFIGVSTPEKTVSFKFQRDFKDRLLNKKMFAAAAVYYLINEIEKYKEG
ncbi:MAG: CinA family nicotinamide mononucleotide deamidase-related protein [Thermodesulfobacteriota bacterium]